MDDWINIALPIGTLVLGSLLTMVGQALRDRRAAGREERARREGFMVANFEVHRSAMLEMQEVVEGCHLAFSEEVRKRERDGLYVYFDQNLRQNAVVMGTRTKEAVEAITEAPSSGEAKEALAKFVSNIGQHTRELEEIEATLTESFTKIEQLFPFWEQLTDFICRLRLCMSRCGSNSVVNAGRVFINSLYEWNEQYSSGERLEQLTEQVRASHYELNRALSNALKFGPYDTYKP